MHIFRLGYINGCAALVGNREGARTVFFGSICYSNNIKFLCEVIYERCIIAIAIYVAELFKNI